MRQVRAVPRLALVRQRVSVALRQAPLAARVAGRAISSSTPTASSTHSFRPLAARGFASSARILAAAPSAAPSTGKDRTIDMDRFPPERIRNLSIIAHIDHGKSTLADRLLQMTNTLPPESSPQFLDKLKVERERGITVKAQTVSIVLKHTDGHDYLVNLIDTPGHVDFSYEVSRSLGACEGALLLVDCTQGIQAQTLSVFQHALEADLKLLGVINKVDLQHAYPEETSQAIAASLGIPKEDHMMISAKSGLGVDNVLHRLIDDLPSPKWEGDDKLRALVFDTFYDRFRGVVSLVRIVSGSIKKGDKVRFIEADKKYDILDVGVYNPEEVSVDSLKEGQVGYLVCNMKNSDEAHIGDTVCMANEPVDPLPGFQPMKAMVYAGIFPMDGSEFVQLEESINRLTLNDRSVSIEKESSAALGQGFRLGFLGTLHMDVFRQRLEDEYESNVIITAPTVPFKVVYVTGKEEFISNPAVFPDVTDTRSRVRHVEEPMVNATIMVPNDYIGEMMELCSRYRGIQKEYTHIEGTDRAILKYSLPLAEIVSDFFSELKSASSGFASFDYEEAGYEKSNLVKMNMLLNGHAVDALSMIIHKNAAKTVGKAWVKKLKDVLPRQLFELAIQAAIGNHVVARESLSAMRKDVTAGLYGGHYERKLKHLNKQKEGKKRLKKLAGNIDVPQQAFFEVLSSRPRTFSTSAILRAEGNTTSPEVPQPPPMLSAEQSKTEQEGDWLSKYFPKAFNVTTPPPTVSRPTLSPKQRSSIMSKLNSQSNGTPLGWDSGEMFSDFTKLYVSSSTPVFAPHELRQIAKAIHTLDRRAGRARMPAQDRLDTVYEALRQVVGHGAKAGLELPLLVAHARHLRAPRREAVQKAQRHFFSLWPDVPTGPKERLAYTRGINHILFLNALIADYTTFGRWWQRLVESNLEIDSYAYLARLTLMGKKRSQQLEEVLPELENALRQVTNNEHRVVLVNSVMSMAAKHQRFDILTPLWDAFKRDEAVDGHAVPEDTILSLELVNLISGLQADRASYTIAAHALSSHGNLTGALEVLQQMIAADMTPDVNNYAHLLRGFGQYGVTPEVASGSASDAFPALVNFEGGNVSVANPWTLLAEAAGEAPLGEIAQQQDPKTSLWTRTALEDLWPAFMSITPLDRVNEPPRAPHPQWIFRVLMAWVRVTNGETEAVARAFTDMERKFGPGNAEGWVFWEENKRLLDIKTALGLGDQTV